MKKISYNDAAYILRYSRTHFIRKYCCKWYLSKDDEYSGVISCCFRWWFFIFAFPVCCVLEFFHCLWDGGLKNFDYLPYKFSSIRIMWDLPQVTDSRFNRFCEVYNGLSKR